MIDSPPLLNAAPWLKARREPFQNVLILDGLANEQDANSRGSWKTVWNSGHNLSSEVRICLQTRIWGDLGNREIARDPGDRRDLENQLP